MKTYLFSALSVIFLFPCGAFADWQSQTSGVTDNLFSVYFVSETNGWAVGSNGRILSTSNGGALWAQQVSNTTQTLFSVVFPAALTGYAIGGSNTVVKTINGGASWSAGTISGMLTLTGVDFADVNTGYACGGDGRVAETTNGGATWTVLNAAAMDLNVIKVIDANTVSIGSLSGTVFRTTNGGTSWTTQTSSSTNFISAITFSDVNNGYFTTLGLSEDVYKTSNGGSSWQQVTSPGNTSGLTDLSLVSSSIVYGAGPTGTIRRTTNSGMNWETQTGADTADLKGIFMVNASVGYAVGYNGRIFKTVNGGIGIQQISTEIPKSFYLSQNYPNPFNPATKIRFALPRGSFTRIVVYDALGRETETLVNEQLGAGTYEVNWDAADMPSGVYFYRLSANDFFETKKLILIK